MIYLIPVLLALIGVVKFDYSGRSHCTGSVNLYFTIQVICVFISGFSYRLGSDTLRYEDIFLEAGTIGDLTIADIVNNDNQPLWVILQSLSKTIFPSFYFFRFLYALFLNIVIFRFIKRETSYIYTALLCYFFLQFFNLNFEIMRQGCALCFFLLGYRYLLENKLKKYYLYCAISFLFHSSAIILTLLPLLRFNITKLRFILILCVSLCLLALSDSFLGTALNILSIGLFDFGSKSSFDMLVSYSDGRYGDGVFSVAKIASCTYSVFLPLFLVFWLNAKYKNNKYNSIIIALCALNILSFSIPIFFRFTKYFDIILTIFYINSFSVINSKNTIIRKLVCPLFLIFYIFHGFSANFNPIRETGIRGIVRYYPYSSIFEQSIDKDRERIELH